MILSRSLWLFAAAGLVISAAGLENGSNVLLVINQNSPESRQIGDYYARRRAVPAANVCRIQTTTVETIERREYDNNIAKPVRACLESRKLSEQVLFIVTTLGTPLRINGGGGIRGDLASVDSELTLLYHAMKGLTLPLNGATPNPYFQADSSFGHPRYPMYLVTRLAAYDVKTVIAMIERGMIARNRGKIVIDMLESDATQGNSWLLAAAAQLPADRVVLDRTPRVLTDRTDVIAYASWGSNDPSRKTRFLNFQWNPGAIMTEYVSTNARTFTRPPAAWQVGGSWKDPSALFFDSPQSLTADYLQEGATGASGHVYEPYLMFTPRPDLLLPSYILKNRNLAESYYSAIPGLSWQNIVVGDPLCRLQ